MLRLFRQYPDAIARTQEIAEACSFSLDELKYVYPQEITTEGRTPREQLSYFVWEGAREKLGRQGKVWRAYSRKDQERYRIRAGFY